MKITSHTNSNGYNDYNINDYMGIYRACVPFGMKRDIFNVYCFENTKYGCVWLGDLESSLMALTQEDFYVEKYLEEAIKKVKEYSDKKMFFRPDPFHSNHLTCVQFKYGFFRTTSNFVDVFLEHPQAIILVLKNQKV